MTDPPASQPRPADTGSGAIHHDIDWQAALLAGKVLRRVMTLAEACEELAGWQSEAIAPGSGWRTVEPRSLIVTHMMNRLLARGD